MAFISLPVRVKEINKGVFNMKNMSKIFGIITLVVIIWISFFACDDGSNDEKSGGNLVNASGEAWVAGNMGYIFKSNGTFDEIYNIEGMWEVEDSGTYKTNGKKLTLTYHESDSSHYSTTVQYSVSGNTGKITYTEGSYSETITLTRTKISIGVWNAPSNSVSLTNGQWVNGNINSYGSGVWYSFNISSGITYHVWWNDEYDGDGSKTLDIEVSAFHSNGTRIFYEDSGWNTPESFTASSNGTVFLRVTGYDDGTGSFAIVYSTGSTRP